MKTPARTELIEELRMQWKTLWRTRIDDKIRAEGIADKDYSTLFVEKGTVIFATRKFKMLNFGEILEQNGIMDADRFVPPNPQVGGWRKFIKTTISTQNSPKRAKRAWQLADVEKKQQQLKKGGRGWVHF